MEVVEFIRGRWVHSGAPWESSASFWVVRFFRVRPCVLRVQSETVGSRWGLSDSFTVVGLI